MLSLQNCELSTLVGKCGVEGRTKKTKKLTTFSLSKYSSSSSSFPVARLMAARRSSKAVLKPMQGVDHVSLERHGHIQCHIFPYDKIVSVNWRLKCHTKCGEGKNSRLKASSIIVCLTGDPVIPMSFWVMVSVLSIIIILCPLILLLFCYKDKMKLLSGRSKSSMNLSLLPVRLLSHTCRRWHKNVNFHKYCHFFSCIFFSTYILLFHFSVNLRSCVQNLKRTRIQQVRWNFC